MAKEIILYMTCRSTEEAEKISASLLNANLIACANIMAPHTALYRWKGKTERAQEVAVIMKSRRVLFSEIQKMVSALHSYDCPCLVSWEIDQGFPPFLQWIEAQTLGEVK